MAVSAGEAERLVSLIAAELGQDANEAFMSRLFAIWDLYSDKGDVEPRLQYLYCKRGAIELLQGQVWQKVTSQEGELRKAWSDLLKNLQIIWQNVDRQINGFGAESASSWEVAAGTLDTVSPYGAEDELLFGLTGNERAYRGDPFYIAAGDG